MEASPFSQLEIQSDGFDLSLNPPFYPPSTSTHFPAQPTKPKPLRHHFTKIQCTLPPNQQQPPLPDVPNVEVFDWNPPLYYETQPNPQKVGIQPHRVVKAPRQAFTNTIHIAGPINPHVDHLHQSPPPPLNNTPTAKLNLIMTLIIT